MGRCFEGKDVSTGLTIYAKYTASESKISRDARENCEAPDIYFGARKKKFFSARDIFVLFYLICLSPRFDELPVTPFVFRHARKEARGEEGGNGVTDGDIDNRFRKFVSTRTYEILSDNFLPLLSAPSSPSSRAKGSILARASLVFFD